MQRALGPDALELADIAHHDGQGEAAGRLHVFEFIEECVQRDLGAPIHDRALVADLVGDGGFAVEVRGNMGVRHCRGIAERRHIGVQRKTVEAALLVAGGHAGEQQGIVVGPEIGHEAPSHVLPLDLVPHRTVRCREPGLHPGPEHRARIACAQRLLGEILFIGVVAHAQAGIDGIGELVVQVHIGGPAPKVADGLVPVLHVAGRARRPGVGAEVVAQEIGVAYVVVVVE